MANLTISPALSALIAAAALVVLAAQPVGAQTTLRWKFQPGETLNYQMNQKMDMKLKAPNAPQPIGNKMTQTIDTTWVVGDVGGDGAALTQKIERIRTTIESPLGKFDYDSKDGKKPEGPVGQLLGPIFDALVGSQFTFKMTELGDVKDVKVPEKLVEALKKSPNMGSGMFSEDNLKNMIVQSTLPLPAEPVTKGKSWEKTIEIPSEPIGSITLDNTYTYDGPVSRPGGDFDKIDLKTKLDFKAKEGVPVVPKVTSQDAKGQFLFDRSKGRLSESDVTQKMGISLKVQNMELTQDIETTSSMKLNPDKGGQ